VLVPLERDSRWKVEISSEHFDLVSVRDDDVFAVAGVVEHLLDGTDRVGDDVGLGGRRVRRCREHGPQHDREDESA
jgi:hypothetical protein